MCVTSVRFPSDLQELVTLGLGCERESRMCPLFCLNCPRDLQYYKTRALATGSSSKICNNPLVFRQYVCLTGDLNSASTYGFVHFPMVMGDQTKKAVNVSCILYSITWNMKPVQSGAFSWLCCMSGNWQCNPNVPLGWHKSLVPALIFTNEP